MEHPTPRQLVVLRIRPNSNFRKFGFCSEPLLTSVSATLRTRLKSFVTVLLTSLRTPALRSLCFLSSRAFSSQFAAYSYSECSPTFPAHLCYRSTKTLTATRNNPTGRIAILLNRVFRSSSACHTNTSMDFSHGLLLLHIFDKHSKLPFWLQTKTMASP